MVPDPAIFLLVQDNIELACQAIEKAAMDRAVIDVDDSFAAAYEIRRRHREVRQTSVHRLRQLNACCSNVPTNRSGILRSPSQTCSTRSRTFCESSLPAFRTPSSKSTKNSVSFLIVDEFAIADFHTDPDPKRRVFTSRPNSTVSYSRADQIPALYSPPPAPEQASQALMRPQEAMDRFNVGVESCFAIQSSYRRYRPWLGI